MKLFENKFAVFEQENGRLDLIYKNYDPTDKEFDDYQAVFKNILLEVKPKVLMVFNMKETKHFRAELRQKGSKWLRENNKLIEEKVSEAYFVVPNIFIKVALKTLFSFSNLPFAYTIVASVEELKRKMPALDTSKH